MYAQKPHRENDHNSRDEVKKQINLLKAKQPMELLSSEDMELIEGMFEDGTTNDEIEASVGEEED